jgi:hypothetical protein
MRSDYEKLVRLCDRALVKRSRDIFQKAAALYSSGSFSDLEKTCAAMLLAAVARRV